MVTLDFLEIFAQQIEIMIWMWYSQKFVNYESYDQDLIGEVPRGQDTCFVEGSWRDHNDPFFSKCKNMPWSVTNGCKSVWTKPKVTLGMFELHQVLINRLELTNALIKYCSE